MGCLCSSPSTLTAEEKQELKEIRKRNKELENLLAMSRRSDRQIHKLLLLGAGESGKSTLFKQMITLHGKGFDEEDRKNYISVIHGNVSASLKTLCQYNQIFLEQYGDAHQLHAELEPLRAYFASMESKHDERLSPEIAMRMDVLWKSNAIKNTYARRNEYQLTDSTNYFLDDIHRICDPDYLPTEQDILRSRVRTTGIVEMPFEIDTTQFKMFDVGGQRNERKKWIHCFEDVTAVLFVVAVSEYDMRLYEDEDVNRMVEALQLFQEIASIQWFKKTPIILFLNKKDLFAEKIETTPITVCPVFENYPGPHDYDNSIEEIRLTFEQSVMQVKGREEAVLYTHITCATDTNQIKHVFNAVKDIVIRKSLAANGLIST